MGDNMEGAGMAGPGTPAGSLVGNKSISQPTNAAELPPVVAGVRTGEVTPLELPSPKPANHAAPPGSLAFFDRFHRPSSSTVGLSVNHFFALHIVFPHCHSTATKQINRPQYAVVHHVCRPMHLLQDLALQLLGHFCQLVFNPIPVSPSAVKLTSWSHLNCSPVIPSFLQ
ncbi:hypothetical protein CORC01_04913 [Colletotrichum orchidophilum]|uniref:Uncharacterized protein n=1 Tax=Colletotrichum orchidophilum TaxID=1209926 RepID=A0A1G4BEL0_9PEZI|nr:uncharacterized protein CORC01_04913 [Colletotrichum orchidophilum]OHE99777.1 hypothetical protein CORC01_04913 [Colletotrichum orchidophilum]